MAQRSTRFGGGARGRFLRVGCAVLALALTACGDDDVGGTGTGQSGLGGEGDGGAGDPSRPASDVIDDTVCEGEDDGEPCADDRHCVDGRCVYNVCGDGVETESEECDDGNVALGDGCSPDCKRVMASCGDGELDLPDEECDDGNDDDEDGCTRDCTRVECGNGRRDPGEECDDGNDVNDDGCANACTRNVCRNGRLDPGEECDDGNRVSDDGCSNACLRVACGDAQVQSGEECDDGNDVDDDGCSNACTENVCGNRRVDPGEVCDGEVTETEVCRPDCSGFDEDTCFDCMKTTCVDYMGFDLFTSCYEAVDATFVPNPAENFVGKCSELDTCIRSSGCYDSTFGTVPCFCGELPSDECQQATRGIGPCAAEFEAATDCPAGARSSFVF